MTPALQFVVYTVPVAQPRQKHRQIGSFIQNYTPTKHPVNAFKSALQDECRKWFSGPVIDGAVSLELLFVLPRPKNKMWKSRPMPRILHTAKPDLDNLQKSVKDALSKIAWRDDSQVCSVKAAKFVASGDERPHVVVIVRTF